MAANANAVDFLGTEKVSRLLIKFAVPGIVSMVVNSIYNIVDQIFIGRGVGYLGNGATTVVFPMTMFFMALTVLMGDGSASFMSLKLGEKKPEDAAKGAASGIVGIILSGILVAIVFLMFLEKFCLLFGASEQILPYAIDYAGITCLGLPALGVCAGISSIIRADGSPKFNMAGLLLGCVINIILDPIFIFVCGWGVKGAALATILGQYANAVLNLYYIRFKIRAVKLDKAAFSGWLSHLPKISRLGVSSFINQFSLVVAIAVRNNILVSYGAKSIYGPDIPVTTLGITMKCFSIIMAVIIGLGGGAQPIYGYNYGSGKYDRVKQTYKYALIVATIVCCIAFAVLQLAPMAVISIFGSESALYNEFAVKCMRIFLLLIPTASVAMVSGVFFQALGYPLQASLVSLSKQIIFTLPATIILPIFMGVEGALWAGPVSDLATLVLTVVMLKMCWKKMFPVEKVNSGMV